MASTNVTDPTAEPRIDLRLSSSLLADYRNRGAFPGLRVENDHKRVGNWAVFSVTIDFAHHVLEDARSRRKEFTNHRGPYIAYNSLIKKLQWALDQSEGVQADPGEEEWRQEVTQFGCHPVGTRLRSVEGVDVKVARAYGLVRVPCEGGEFRDDEGRFNRRLGYVCEDEETGKRFFWSAGELHTRDGAITHLRLAVDVGVAPAAAAAPERAATDFDWWASLSDKERAFIHGYMRDRCGGA
jgi:hypothetical protein